MFTDNQQKIVQQILEKKVNDLFSFIWENKLYTLEETKDYREDEHKKYERLINELRSGSEGGMGKKSKINIIDFENSFKLLIDYFYVIRKSRKNELLSFGQSREFLGKDIFDVSDESRKYEKQIDNLNIIFYNYEDCKFYPNPELNYFVDRGYLTEDEFYKKEEDKDRKATLKKASISLWASIIIFAIATIINFCLYTKDREVYIKNNKDTIKVIIAEPQKTLSDTLQTKPDK
jgi:hypothetical protein